MGIAGGGARVVARRRPVVSKARRREWVCWVVLGMVGAAAEGERGERGSCSLLVSLEAERREARGGAALPCLLGRGVEMCGVRASVLTAIPTYLPTSPTSLPSFQEKNLASRSREKIDPAPARSPSYLPISPHFHTSSAYPR